MGSASAGPAAASKATLAAAQARRRALEAILTGTLTAMGGSTRSGWSFSIGTHEGNATWKSRFRSQPTADRPAGPTHDSPRLLATISCLEAGCDIVTGRRASVDLTMI